LTKGAKHIVFKPIGEDEFEPVVIEAVRIDSNTYEIKHGLVEGDKVIDRALFMLDADAITNGLYDNDDDEEW
jgi:Cu(I)/Ag(I) efflux system membrane fusion protein